MTWLREALQRLRPSRFRIRRTTARRNDCNPRLTWTGVAEPGSLATKIRRAICAAVLLGAMLWAALLSVAEDSKLVRVWSAPGISVQQRAKAVNGAFTNGTPIRMVLAALCTNYGVLRPLSSVWVGPGPEPPKTCSLFYQFGEDSVTIGTSADIAGDPLTGKFTGAGCLVPATRPTEKTNRIRIGQQDGWLMKPDAAASDYAEEAGFSGLNVSSYIGGYREAYIQNLITEKEHLLVNYAGDKAWGRGYDQGIRDSKSTPQFTMLDFGYNYFSGTGTFISSFERAQFSPTGSNEKWWYENPLALAFKTESECHVEGWITGKGQFGHMGKYQRTFLVISVK